MGRMGARLESGSLGEGLGWHVTGGAGFCSIGNAEKLPKARFTRASKQWDSSWNHD